MAIRSRSSICIEKSLATLPHNDANRYLAQDDLGNGGSPRRVAQASLGRSSPRVECRKTLFDNNLRLFTKRGCIRNLVVYRLHYLEVRYATIQPSRSLLLFRLLDRLGTGPIWIGGI